MAERIVYFDKFNSNKSLELKEFALDKLKDNEGYRLHYILPNADLLKKYRYEFIDKIDFLFDLKVDTFDDIVGYILKYDLSKSIEKPMKNFILKNIVEDLLIEGKITYYKDLAELDGFIEFVGDKIGEIKRSIVYPDEYINKSAHKIEFYEIGLIYKRYEEYLSTNKLLDREGKYFKAIDILKENDKKYIDAEIVIIDYFYDFRPVELEIIKELLKTNSNIYINIPFYTEKENMIVSKTLLDLENLGFKIDYLIKKDKKLSDNIFENIGKKMFSMDKVDIKENQIEIVKAPDRSSEINNVFLEIKKLYISGVYLKDIALVLTDDSYDQVVYQIAHENEIAINTSRKQYLFEQPIIIEIMNIFKNVVSDSYKFDMINRLNSHYFRLMDEEKLSNTKLNNIEMIIRKLEVHKLEGTGIKEKKDYFINLYDAFNLGKLEKDREDYKDIICEIIELIDLEILSIKNYNTISNFNKNINDLIKDYKIYEEITENYNNIGNKELFLRDIRTLNALEKILINMEEVYSINKRISLEEYIFIFEQYISDTQILIKEAAKNGVKILNTVTSRGEGYKYVFIVGLTQGQYPNIALGDSLNNKENFDFIKSLGINILSYNETLDKESMNLISGISKVEDKLYLSYYSGKDDSKIESMYISEIKRLVANDDLITSKSVRLSERFDIHSENIKNKNELLYFTINDSKNKKFLNSSLDRINNKLSPGRINTLIDINLGEYYRENNIFNEYQGYLRNENNILEVKEFNDRPYSISYIEDYARCPYSFMLSRVLKVDELLREFEEYDHMEIGNIYHEILMQFYLAYKDVIKSNIENGLDFDRNLIDENIYKWLIDIFRKLGINIVEMKNFIIFKMIKRNLITYINYDLDMIFINKFIPEEFEKSFEGFNIKKDNKVIEIVGKIDRIDKALYSDYYTVFDYKTSIFGLKKLKDIENKTSFQLPVYILSQMNKDVIQGGYGIIKGATNEYIMVKEDVSPFNKRNNSLTVDEWNDILDESIENIFQINKEIDKANFSVEPKECSDYCIYKDICRYKKIRR